MKLKNLENMYIISPNKKEYMTWIYNKNSKELTFKSTSTLFSSLLKGLQDFSNELDTKNYYQLILSEKVFVGTIIEINHQKVCYFVIELSSGDIKEIKKNNKFMEKIENKLRNFLKNQSHQLSSLFDSKFEKIILKFIQIID